MAKEAIELTARPDAPVLNTYVGHTQTVLNKVLKAIGDGTADSITVEKLDDLDKADETNKGDLAEQFGKQEGKAKEYRTHLNGLDVGVADIAAKSAGVSNTAHREVMDLKDDIQGIIGAVPQDPPLSRQMEAISAIDKAVGDTEHTVTNAHNQLSGNSFNVPSHSYGAPSSSAIPHNSSGGYNSGYTDKVSSASGSNAKNVLSKEELIKHIGEALDALGITDPAARARWTEGYLTLIQRESGGNAGSINNWDSNAAAGHASQGLTQTIPSTFEAYHVKGTSNVITDPTANIASSMNYVMSRYDVSRDGSNLTANVQQADANRSPKGY
ncbi:hypothetical protein BJY24_007645 [Nocardia transvalensis]|uniref:Transglycosylase SLT domain-containing protein n=1 Tax=Nocardia transvalensis TaxID=37333 RepID=A0A7W9PN82_9NOCA|nr:transglycosylase SLT domain-containing protein [Nocardia transvalensis]MBB5918733.1 hypothetical protein [Nocardia transvalensis]